MKKLIVLIGIGLIANQIQSQDANIEATKAKIESLKKQKDGLESEINGLIATLPQAMVPNWKYKGNAAINTGLNLLGSDWAASFGGNSTINLGGSGHIEANYKKGRHEWNNSFDGLIGFFKNVNVDSGVNDNINKNSDMLQLSSKYLFDTKKANLKLGIGMNFLSQFIETVNLGNGNLVSDFLAPGILDLSPGLEWSPAPYFNVFFAPASGRMTFVRTDRVFNGATSELRFGNEFGQGVRTELGARAVLSFDKEVIKNLTFRSKAQLFNNWSRPEDQLNKISSSRANIDVNWQNDIFYKLTKNIALNFGFQLMRDDDVRLADKAAIGTTYAPWNFRQNFGVAFVTGF